MTLTAWAPCRFATGHLASSATCAIRPLLLSHPSNLRAVVCVLLHIQACTCMGAYVSSGTVLSAFSLWMPSQNSEDLHCGPTVVWIVYGGCEEGKRRTQWTDSCTSRGQLSTFVASIFARRYFLLDKKIEKERKREKQEERYSLFVSKTFLRRARRDLQGLKTRKTLEKDGWFNRGSTDSGKFCMRDEWAV